MLNILVVEDNDIRVRRFLDAFKNKCNYNCTDNAKDAIVLIDKNPYDLIFLDHDLGGKIYMDVNAQNTGSTVARHLRDSRKNEDALIIIHSHNPCGAKNMQSFIPRALIIPFMNLDINKVIDYQIENIKETGEIG